jgi:putative hydrolase of the HAD superfamily
MILLFDAANTLIHKPTFYDVFIQTLDEFGSKVEPMDFQKNHKLISELITFPDRTSKSFYHEFNKEVLYSLGIIPTEEMLNRLHEACSYLPWEKFDDTSVLQELPFEKAVLSNFHGGLSNILDSLFPNEFSVIYSSENENLRKPDVQFFSNAIKKSGVEPSEIIYIGDSIKLDLEPALEVGMNAWLIDRNNNHPYCKRKINSFSEIKNLI